MLNRTPLDDILKLKITDYPLIRLHDSKKDLLKENLQNIDKKLMVLITEANINPELEQLCKNPEFDQLWNTLYNEIAAYFTEEKTDGVSLTITYEQPGIPCFDFMRGIYFFYHSQQMHRDTAEEKHNQKTDTLSLLEQAIQYHSIHAMQRYHELRYQEIELNNSNPSDIFKEIIKNCKTIQPFYGSFAYVMLAEAYCRYACWLVSDKLTTSF